MKKVNGVLLAFLVFFMLLIPIFNFEDNEVSSATISGIWDNERDWESVDADSQLGLSSSEHLAYVNGYWYLIYRDIVSLSLRYKSTDDGLTWGSETILYDSNDVYLWDVSGFDYHNATEYLILVFVHEESGPLYYMDCYVYACLNDGTLYLARQNDSVEDMGQYVTTNLAVDWTPNFGADGSINVCATGYWSGYYIKGYTSTNLGSTFNEQYLGSSGSMNERYITPVVIYDNISSRQLHIYGPDYMSTHDIWYNIKPTSGGYPIWTPQYFDYAGEYDFPTNVVKRDEFDAVGFVNGTGTRDIWVYFCWIDADQDVNFDRKYSVDPSINLMGNCIREIADGSVNPYRSCTISQRSDKQLDLFYATESTVYCRSSTDEGNTWGSPVMVGTALGDSGNAYCISSQRHGWGFSSSFDCGGVAVNFDVHPDSEIGVFLGSDYHPLSVPYWSTNITILNKEGCGDWVFAEEKYYNFEVSYSIPRSFADPEIFYMYFRDGYNNINVSYTVSTDVFAIEEGEDYINLRYGVYDGHVGNTSQVDFYNVTYSIYFEDTIIDAWNIDVQTFGVDENGTASSWSTTTDLFNIYNLGGRSQLYDQSGNSGRVSGGDVFDLFAGGGTYNPPDIMEEYWEYGQIQTNIWEIELNADVDPTHDISIVDWPYQSNTPYEFDHFSLKMFDNNVGSQFATIWTELDPETTATYSVQVYARVSSNIIQGYSYIRLTYYGPGVTTDVCVLRFGFTSDTDTFYADDDVGTHSLGIDYVADTWYNITFHVDQINDQYDIWINGVLRANDYSFVYAIDPNRLKMEIDAWNGTRTTYFDSIKAWRDFSGGTGGQVTSYSIYRKLQHFYGFIEFETEDFAISNNVNEDVYEQGYFEFGLNVCNLEDVWYQQFKARISVYDGRLNDENNWILWKIEWFERTNLIRTDYQYSYWEGYEGNADFTRLFIDLWFNKANASSYIGGRVNSEYYGMNDHSAWYLRWFIGRDWSAMVHERSYSLFNYDLLNSTNDIYSSRTITLFQPWVKIYRSNNYDFIYQVKFNELGFTSASGKYEGIDTPTITETKIRDMPQSGLVHSILQGFRTAMMYLYNGIVYGALLIWGVLVSFLDTVAGWLGYPKLFSNFFSWLSSFWTWMINGIGWMITMMTDLFSLFAQMMTSGLQIFTIFVVQWLRILQAVTGLFTGVYTSGINLMTDYNLLAWLELVGVVWMIWLFYLMHDKGLGAVADHFMFVFNVIMFLFNIFLGIAQFFVNLIGRIIESIPVVE